MFTLAHVQKDDSSVPILPYAAGCFLAAILLTISGIAETHPQALALATDLIQLGWLLLQIQGIQLVQASGQCMTLFHVWLVMVQLFDVHRRGLQTFITMPTSGDWSKDIAGYNLDSGRENRSGFDQGQGQAVMATVRAFYRSMLCNALPAACDMAFFSPGPVADTQGCSNMASSPLIPGAVSAAMETMASDGIPGMREMEYMVLFEIAAGLVVSGIMFLAWMAMAIQQGQGSRYTSARLRRLGARWQRIEKTIKGHARDWKALLEARIE
ncbi:hypothetical protein BGX31_002912 [Mortierella sp. GBA43]|nr:hypothetical protein BGX31_002912 [Mortierella sp. GBA43]